MECHIYVCIVNLHCCLSYLHYQGLHRSIVFSIEKKRGNRWQPRMFDAQGLLLKSQDLLLKSQFFPSLNRLNPPFLLVKSGFLLNATPSSRPARTLRVGELIRPGGWLLCGTWSHFLVIYSGHVRIQKAMFISNIIYIYIYIICYTYIYIYSLYMLFIYITKYTYIYTRAKPLSRRRLKLLKTEGVSWFLEISNGKMLQNAICPHISIFLFLCFTTSSEHKQKKAKSVTSLTC